MHYLPQDPFHEHTRADVRGWTPRTRLLMAAAVVTIVSCLSPTFEPLAGRIPSPPIYGFVAFTIAAVIVVANVSWRYLTWRWLVFLPWIALLAAAMPISRGWEQGGMAMAGVMLKAWLAFTTLLVLVRTTPVDELLRALGQLGVPALLVATIATLDRYLFVLLDEFHRLRRAQQSRTFGRSRWRQFATTASLLGLILVRAVNRADRIHAAMLSRGFDGKLRLLRRE